MPSPAAAAVARLRRRVRLGTFAAGVGDATLAAAAVAAVALLALRVAGAPAVPAAWWLAALLPIVLVGWWRARGAGFDDRTLAVHLEQRRPTGGLLLAAVDGAALSPAFQTQLAERLGDVRTALPALRWRHLLPRPLLASAIAAVVALLPPPAPVASGAAAAAAIARLDAAIAQLEAEPALPPGGAASLRSAVDDLAQRAARGDRELWREIDLLDARVARERQLAGLPPGEGTGAGAGTGDGARDGGGGGGDADGRSGPGHPGVAPAPSQAALAPMLEALAAAPARERLPAAVRAALQQALTPDGAVDPQRLPADDASRRELAAAIGDAAERLAADPDALAGLSAAAGAEFAARLAAIAEQLAAADADPGAGEPGDGRVADAGDAGDAGAAPSGTGGATDSSAGGSAAGGELAQAVAQAAAQLADLGALARLAESLPASLRDSIGEALAQAAAAAAAGIDPATLRALLPDDLGGLTELARACADAANALAGADGGLPPATAAQLRALQERLGAALQQAGGAGSGPAGRSGGDASGAASSGANASPGGDHVALRLHEAAVGGAPAELLLPAVGPGDDLAREWVPIGTRRIDPEDVAPPDGAAGAPAAGAGRGRAPAAGADAAGGAAWQLRLRPHHRDVVQRFFGDGERQRDRR